jgi:hypothetical protein
MLVTYPLHLRMIRHGVIYWGGTHIAESTINSKVERFEAPVL